VTFPSHFAHFALRGPPVARSNGKQINNDVALPGPARAKFSANVSFVAAARPVTKI
jgi:hypothetical protein